jgi:hypothetical protein
MLDRRTWEACPIDCTESLGNIYENRSQTCHPKDKTYRDAQLGELTHSVTADHMLEHGVVCRSEHVGEKCGEGETATGQQLPRASSCEAAMSSRGRRLGVAEEPLQGNTKLPFLMRKCQSGFTTFPPAPLQEQPALVCLLERA